MSAVISLARRRAAASAEETRLPKVIELLTESLAKVGRVDSQILKAWGWINDAAHDDKATADAIRSLALINPKECIELQRAHIDEMIRQYAEEHLADLLEYFHLTDADIAYDAALDNGEV